jgi:hypothetical protein
MKLKHILFFFSAIIFSCNNESAIEPAKDTEGPAIEFTQAATRELSGSIELEFKATDNTAIAHIQVLVDDVMIAQEDFSNASATFSFFWNSETVEDGPHTIKVIVEDNAGNITINTFKIIVLNSLLRLSIPANYITEGNTLWVFLSDNAGNLLGTQEAQNNSELVFEKPDGFDDSTFVINTLKKEVLVAGSYQRTTRSLESYTNIKPGIFHLTTSTLEDPMENKGKFTITITNVPTGYYEVIGGPVYDTEGVYDGSNYVVSVYLTKDQSDLSVALHHSEGNARLAFINNAQINGETTLSFNDLNVMPMSSTLTPGADQIFQSQTGYKTGSTQGYIYNNYSGYDEGAYKDAVHSYSPADGIFNSHFTVFSEYIGDLSNVHINYGSQPAKSFKRLQTAVSSYNIAEKDIQVNFTNIEGTYTSLSSFKVTFINNGSLWDGWNVFTPVTMNTGIKLPAIPAEIIDAEFSTGIPTYNFDLLAIYDFDIYSNYQAYITSVFNYNAQTVESYEWLSQTITLPNKNGRGLQHSHTPSIPNLPANDQLSILKVMNQMSKNKRPNM